MLAVIVAGLTIPRMYQSKYIVTDAKFTLLRMDVMDTVSASVA